ncbi:hypothetical protein [Prosthecomicrobium sp. N25]|uniref:hypothetical protein n=1 Tax=Prosthecomicrobium sp. N25 TaxID=3129254 RepID=UPI0030781D64
MTDGIGRKAEDPVPTGVAAYKTVLREVLERRPSGMRRRLAEALGRNPSFVSQITNPAYPTPIPVAHIETILEICHFSAAEKARFLAAYEAAHPRRARLAHHAPKTRLVSLRVPDLGDPAKNKALDDLLHDLAARVAGLAED